MTQAQWKTYYRKQAAKHEMFAALALFAACEGGIRRDFEWRSNGGFGQAHQDRFRKLRAPANNAHVSLSSILEGWMAAERNNRWLCQHLARLLELFRQRNDLAHGRVLQGIAFEPVYESMHLTREKWRAAVSDFRGY